MEEHIKQLTHWVNHLLGPLALQLLHALQIQPADYEHPIPEYVVMSVVVLIIGTFLAMILRTSFSRTNRCIGSAGDGTKSKCS